MKTLSSFWVLLFGSFSLTTLVSVSAQVQYQCDPCIARGDTHIQAIVHGSSTDDSWLQIKAGMQQASSDMKVGFDIAFAGDDVSSLEALYSNMASGIKRAAEESHALIVSIPDDDNKEIQAAVLAAIESGTPVFGLERGYALASSLGLSAFIGMDDGLAGKTAAQHFDSAFAGASLSKVLFVRLDDDINNKVYAARLQGLKDGLANGNNTKQATVDEMVLDTASAADLANAVDGCSYEAILVGSSSDELVNLILSALADKGCDNTITGTFGTSIAIHKAVSGGKLSFAISEQRYLQGAMSVVHAALYVTTGKYLAPSSESPYGMLLSGPEMVTSDTAMTDTFQVCEADGFPVCPIDVSLDGINPSKCACTERPKMKIAGVLHAVTTDSFWDIVYTAANQAADDFGVELELDRMKPDTADVLHFKMATQIEKLCQEGIQGIFVTIPSDAVLDAVRLCQQLNVPVVSINAGPDFSRDLGLQHHLGMVEFNAGYLAGKRMLASELVKKAVCLDHAPGNVALIDRCGGFEKAVNEANIPYLGQVTVPDDNSGLYVNNVETFIETENSNDWSGLGVLLGGTPQHEPGLMLKDKHPEIIIGAFDTSDALYEGLQNDKLLFGMDQGPYLQGYLPIPLLAWEAQTMQSSVNHLIESGPDFVTTSPSQAQVTCEANHFKTCDWGAVSTAAGQDVGESIPSPAGGSPANSTKLNNAAIIPLAIVAAVCVSAIGFLAYRMNLLKKYVHRLEEQGQTPPAMSTGDYVTSAFMDPKKVVSRKNVTGSDEPVVESDEANEPSLKC